MNNALTLLAETIDRGFNGRYCYHIEAVSTRWLLSRVKTVLQTLPKHYRLTHKRLNEAVKKAAQEKTLPDAAHRLLDRIDHAQTLLICG